MSVRRSTSPQFSGSASDRRSDGQCPHRAAADVVGHWGAGGLLVELRRLAVEHGEQTPAEVAAVLAPLGALLAAYAPTASVTAGLAYRGDPCPLCAGAEASAARYRAGLDEGRVDG